MSPSFLTERQRQILDFIEDFQARRGIAPTHREICEEFGYSSYGTVHKHLKLLREKGFLRRVQHQKRGIELVEQERPAAGGSREQATESVTELPFLGRIAAGRPIEALSGDETLGVPLDLLAGRPDQHYILRVAGDSMIDEGIHDGDFVVVQSRELAEKSEMVVALIEGEVTLKRFFPEGRRVRLQPSNREMEPIYVDADKLQIQGVVVGLLRKY